MQDSIQSILLKTASFLHEASIEYFVFGGAAAGILGYPRFTADVDVVIKIKNEDMELFLQSAKKHGFDVHLENHIRRLQTSKILKLRMDDYSVDFVVGETFFDESAFRRKKKVKLAGKNIFIASPEDLILYKLISKRHMDLADIERIMFANKKNLGVRYMKVMAGRLSNELGMPHIPSLLTEMLAETQ